MTGFAARAANVRYQAANFRSIRAFTEASTSMAHISPTAGLTRPNRLLSFGWPVSCRAPVTSARTGLLGTLVIAPVAGWDRRSVNGVSDGLRHCRALRSRLAFVAEQLRSEPKWW